MRFLLAAVLAISLSGCASISPPPLAMAPAAAPVTQREHVLGEPIEVFVGNAIVKLKAFQTVLRNDVMTVDVPCRVIGSPLIFAATFTPGQQVQVLGQRSCDSGQCRILASGDGDMWGPIGFTIDSSGRPFGAPVRMRGGALMAGAIRTEPDCRFLPLQGAPTGAAGGPYRNFEILYSGLDGETMRFQYREYTLEDMARPAFSQEFTYPRATKAVRFKDVAFDVLDAAPDRIRVVVRADGAADAPR
jgi:hypothetical protein